MIHLVSYQEARGKVTECVQEMKNKSETVSAFVFLFTSIERKRRAAAFCLNDVYILYILYSTKKRFFYTLARKI